MDHHHASVPPSHLFPAPRAHASPDRTSSLQLQQTTTYSPSILNGLYLTQQPNSPLLNTRAHASPDPRVQLSKSKTPLSSLHPHWPILNTRTQLSSSQQHDHTPLPTRTCSSQPQQPTPYPPLILLGLHSTQQLIYPPRGPRISSSSTSIPNDYGMELPPPYPPSILLGIYPQEDPEYPLPKSIPKDYGLDLLPLSSLRPPWRILGTTANITTKRTPNILSLQVHPERLRDGPSPPILPSSSLAILGTTTNIPTKRTPNILSLQVHPEGVRPPSSILPPSSLAILGTTTNIPTKRTPNILSLQIHPEGVRPPSSILPPSSLAYTRHNSQYTNQEDPEYPLPTTPSQPPWPIPSKKAHIHTKRTPTTGWSSPCYGPHGSHRVTTTNPLILPASSLAYTHHSSQYTTKRTPNYGMELPLLRSPRQPPCHNHQPPYPPRILLGVYPTQQPIYTPREPRPNILSLQLHPERLRDGGPPVTVPTVAAVVALLPHGSRPGYIYLAPLAS